MDQIDNFTSESFFTPFYSIENEPFFSQDYINFEYFPFNSSSSNEHENKETIEIRIKREDEDKDETKVSKNNNLGRKRKESTQNKESKKYHDRFGKDNLKSKVQNHFISFIVSYVNYILPFLGYRKQFYKLSYKDKIKMKFSSLKDKNIGEILQKKVSTSFTTVNCNENIKIFNEIKDEPGVNNLFSEKYLELFNNIYYKNKRYINLSNYGQNINIHLPSKDIKMFEDLLEKINIKDDINEIRENRSNEEYKEELIKLVENIYLKI